MKNIVIVGAATPGKFGNEVVQRCRAMGHRVKVLTWYETDKLDTAWADFNDHRSVVTTFRDLTQDLDHIDVLLYNAHAFDYPDDPSHFTSSCADIDVDAYVQNLRVQVMIPHALALAALRKMDHRSAMIFMTTGLALDHGKTEYTQFAGYAGAKSWVTHLMLALAFNNDRGAVCAAISPFLDYGDQAKLDATIDSIVNTVLHLDSTQNGAIIQQW